MIGSATKLAREFAANVLDHPTAGDPRAAVQGLIAAIADDYCMSMTEATAHLVSDPADDQFQSLLALLGLNLDPIAAPVYTREPTDTLLLEADDSIAYGGDAPPVKRERANLFDPKHQAHANDARLRRLARAGNPDTFWSRELAIMVRLHAIAFHDGRRRQALVHLVRSNTLARRVFRLAIGVDV